MLEYLLAAAADLNLDAVSGPSRGPLGANALSTDFNLCRCLAGAAAAQDCAEGATLVQTRM